MNRGKKPADVGSGSPVREGGEDVTVGKKSTHVGSGSPVRKGGRGVTTDRARTPGGTPAGGEFAARPHGEPGDVALAELAANLYPNGVCGSCGQGLTDDGRCQNDEDSCGRSGQVVDPDLHEQWEADQSIEPLTYPLDLEDFVHVEATIDAIDAAIAAAADGTNGTGSVLHAVVDRLRSEGFEVDDAGTRFITDPGMSALFVDQWPPGTKDHAVVDGAVTRNWKGYGFTPSEMRRWKRVGISEPSLARKLHHSEFAVRPELLALRSHDGTTIGEKVASGEIEWFDAAAAARKAALIAAHRESTRVGF